jgi:ATP-dependent Clp protease adapter protein ClpS
MPLACHAGAMAWSCVRDGTTTVPVVQPEVVPRVDPDAGWRVVLFDDDVTPFDLVVLAIQKAASLSLEVAQMIANETQAQGQAVVKRGLTNEDANIVCGLLKTYTRLEGVCPGVRCMAERDETGM